jgi:hypothetical protein
MVIYGSALLTRPPGVGERPVREQRMQPPYCAVLVAFPADLGPEKQVIDTGEREHGFTIALDGLGARRWNITDEQPLR